MNTECKKMYGNNVGNAQFAAQNPPFEPRLPGPLCRPLVKVNLSKLLIRNKLKYLSKIKIFVETYVLCGPFLK